jgi:peptidylprolyl isomerase
VNNFRAITHPTRARALTALVALGAGLLIAGCGGSSGGSSTLTIGNENTADNALIKSSATASSTTSTSTTPSTTESTASVKTPTTGPLSKKPTAPVGHGSAPTKLITTDVIKGTGAEAKSGSSVVVNYVGVIWKTGKEFDSSWKRSETFPFTLGSGQVIKGWEQGVVGMKVGGRRILEIPSELAYGSKGTSGIPPNTPLTFVIDLLKA